MIGKILRWAIVLALLVILISGSVAFYTVFFGGKDLVIPPLREMSVLDAVESAERMGLEVRIEQIDSSVPVGTVLAQWPDPGTKVRKDKTVILKVSKGGNRQAITDLRGLEQGQALRMIEEQGFSAGEILRVHDGNRPAGTVIAQNPASPAMIEGGRKIELLISMGPLPKDGRIPVPDLAQRDEKTARELLLQSGLRVGGVEYVNTQHTPDGMVMATRPKTGAMIRQGDAVVIQVATSRRKEPELVPETRAATPTPPPQGEVVVEQPQTPVRQIGPAGPVQTLTPEQQELAGAIGLPVDRPPAAATPTPSTPPAVRPGPASTGTARIRYQVPPLTKPLSLKIEMVDATGTKALHGRDVKGGEFISLDAPFVTEAVVTVYLGGEFVWQERYK
ncbi:MAG TPA: PASTA domain-containing protein [Synergistales bacterium]|nr:PASTA domain-containing protein [Synergistaceae bacterium]MDD3915519.1 PASTA domain-containing protein [Synergistaceae bacterium]NCC60961.1 PASTA domain-containing protein [Verrucomicrobiae bacterium]HPE65820.1 PASTA domain-containing protein [Synergistales bacterium]